MNSRKVVNTLILDLDNTIFDWFAVWYNSFEPIYNEIIKQTGRPKDEVEADIRRVHQMRHTSEYTFLLEELNILADLRDRVDIRSQFASALEESRRARDSKLSLYPTVFRSLWDIKRKGTKIIAYTESMTFYSAYRLKRFGLDGVIDILFSPQDHDLPAGVSVEKLRQLPDEYYELQVTEIRHTPPGELKPNPRVLLDIISSIGAEPGRCAYVGDSLFKDVAMARDCGVLDLHARYGESQRKPEYSLLQRVSHWTEEDVQRERDITKNKTDIEPSVVLKEVFSEIHMYCDFEKFDSSTEQLDNESKKNIIDIWKKTIDVQQHFNDLEMRIRNLAITIVGALVAAVGFTYQQGLQTEIFGLHFAAGIGLIVAAGFAWGAFYLMDRFWYHFLLKGAVDHATKIETEFADKIPGIALGKTISGVSGNVHILGIKMNSTRRLVWFYRIGFGMLAVLFICLLFSAPITQQPNPPAATPTKQTTQPAG